MTDEIEQLRRDGEPETAAEASALARRIASSVVARGVVRGDFGEGRLREAATTLARTLHRAADKGPAALSESIGEARRHLDLAAVTLTRTPRLATYGDGIERAKTSVTAAIAALDCASALADGTLCAGCAEVERHPGEGRACEEHPDPVPDSIGPRGSSYDGAHS